MGALYGMPNLDVLWDYAKRYFGKVADLTLAEMPVGREALGEQIQLVLSVIAEMAKEFARDHDGAYGASLMLAVSREDIPRLSEVLRTPHRPEDDPVEDGHPNGKLRFAGYRTDVSAQSGLLILPADLALKALPGPGLPQKDYPLVSLPIRFAPLDTVLPGAPRAVLDGYSVHNDTRTLADEDCMGLAPATREEVRAYFGPGGDGEAIRSMASVRIGRSGSDPVGVVNVDTNTENVLGADDAYHKTFIALVQPLLRLLEPLVRAFADAWWTEEGVVPNGKTLPPQAATQA